MVTATAKAEYVEGYIVIDGARDRWRDSWRDRRRDRVRETLKQREIDKCSGLR
jgi:hypothetical protein